MANRETEDNGQAILDGNSRVLAARLADAKFFWENDLRVARDGMGPWLEKLGAVTFHNRLGSVAGRIDRYEYTRGGFANAADPDAGAVNERKAMVLEMDDGTEIGVVQIAGLVARRIVTFHAPGERLGAGERYGLIRFGSRVELYLPPDVHALVAVGQYVAGGETVLAELTGASPARETITI